MLKKVLFIALFGISSLVLISCGGGGSSSNGSTSNNTPDVIKAAICSKLVAAEPSGRLFEPEGITPELAKYGKEANLLSLNTKFQIKLARPLYIVEATDPSSGNKYNINEKLDATVTNQTSKKVYNGVIEYDNVLNTNVMTFNNIMPETLDPNTVYELRVTYSVSGNCGDSINTIDMYSFKTESNNN